MCLVVPIMSISIVRTFADFAIVHVKPALEPPILRVGHAEILAL